MPRLNLDTRNATLKERELLRRIAIAAGVCTACALAGFLFGMRFNSNFAAAGGGKGETENMMMNGNDTLEPLRYTGSMAQGETDTGWETVLVNAWNPLPTGFQPQLAAVNNEHAFDQRAIQYLETMLADAQRAGLSPIICSSYRTEEYQWTLFDQQVQKQRRMGYEGEEAVKRAKTVVAYPGTSEHELGLAVDIVAQSYQHLEDDQADTPEAQWLMQNCQNYGFILRYPKGKEDITGVIYEPWHYRYVGVDVAREIMEESICLEEYLGMT